MAKYQVFGYGNLIDIIDKDQFPVNAYHTLAFQLSHGGDNNSYCYLGGIDNFLGASVSSYQGKVNQFTWRSMPSVNYLGKAYHQVAINKNRQPLFMSQDNSGTYSTSTSTLLFIGRRYYSNNGGGYAQMNLGELILFKRALTDDEVSQVETYLSKKWGIQKIS